jgi:hypothetical protein
MADDYTMDDGDSGSGRSLMKAPRSVAEFKPPRASSMISEMASLQRNEEHWAEIVPYLDALAGVGPTIFGSAKYDETGCMFAVKEICNANGYTLLAKASPAELSPIFKRAYFRNTGQRVRQLAKQGAQLRLEYKRQHQHD